MLDIPQREKHVTRRGRDRSRDEGDYRPPSRHDCDEIAWDYLEGSQHTVRVIRRAWLLRGVITEFAVSIKVLTPDGWAEVERIDCRHGHSHLHARNGAVIHLDRLDRIDDVERAHGVIDEIIEERLRILEMREDR